MNIFGGTKLMLLVGRLIIDALSSSQGAYNPVFPDIIGKTAPNPSTDPTARHYLNQARFKPCRLRLCCNIVTLS